MQIFLTISRGVRELSRDICSQRNTVTTEPDDIQLQPAALLEELALER